MAPPLGVHPKVVSEMLGHTQIGIALDLYSHVTVTMQRQAVTALYDLFGDLEPWAVSLPVNRGRRGQSPASARSSVERAADF